MCGKNKPNKKNKNMETIILVSVLSTIGVISVILSVVIAFMKLKTKVDVTNYNSELKTIYDMISDMERNHKIQIGDVYDQTHRMNEETNRDLKEGVINLYRHVDSRCDKLDSKIKTSSVEVKTEK